MNSKIIFRVDGSSEMGLGHLVRCIALAHMLKEEFDIKFVSRLIPDKIINELASNNFHLQIISNENNFFDLINPDNIVILDGYNFDLGYQNQIKAVGCKLVCIDDLHDKEFVADLIINHAPGITPHDYNAQPYTKYALGSDYAMLRPAFLEQAKKHRIIDKIETVMICLGGSDPMDLTKCILQVVADFSYFKKIIVVTGATYKIKSSFKKLVDRDIRIDHRHALNELQMLNTMLVADLAIVPASGILFEALSSGCFVITGSYISNQNNILKGFSTLDAIEETENLSNPKSALLKFTAGPLPFRKPSIDGESRIRILNKIKAL